MTFVFISVGLVAGVLSGIFGIGGGIVIVPSLVFFAGMTGMVLALGLVMLAVAIWEFSTTE